MKANASATPPNWASTPDSEVTNRFVTLSTFAVLTAYARTAPSTAPTAAVTAERTTDWRRARTTTGSERAERLSRVKSAVVVEERADEDDERRDEQEDGRVREERDDTEEGTRWPPATGCPPAEGHQPTALAQFSAR